MSATVEADIFSQYFGGGPCVTIPGYTFPVDICYLEDAISLAKYDPKRSGGQQPRQNPGGRPGGGGRGSGARTCRCSGAVLFALPIPSVRSFPALSPSIYLITVLTAAMPECLSGRENVPRLTDWTKFPVRTKQIVDQIDGDTARDKLE